MNLENLKKSDVDKTIAGICGGLGEHTTIPSWLWKSIFITLIFFNLIGLVAYVCLWVFMPNRSIDIQTYLSEDEIQDFAEWYKNTSGLTTSSTEELVNLYREQRCYA